MNKSDLLKFIELYNLGGFVPAVKLVSDGDSLKTSFVSDDRTLAGSVSVSSIKIETGEYGIYDTAQLKKMLSVLEDNIEITVNKNDNRAISLSITDNSTDSVFMLADLSVIPAAPKVKEIKTYDVEIPIDDNFVDKFTRAKSALPEVNTFTLLTNKKGKMELVIGYSSIATNRIKLDVSPVAGKDKLESPISFNADYFREVLNKNKGATGAVYKIAAAGISNLSFKTNDYESNYFLIKKEIDN
jgi:hypothetical protein